MLDRLTSMSAFVKAADAGSFTAAANSLGMSAQMVAKHVVALEDQLGGKLIARTTRQQSLTELGRIYHEQCKLILAEVEAADALAAQLKSEPRGRLRISAPLTFGAHGLVPLMTRYLMTHPLVEVDLVLTDRIVDLIEEGFEVAFRIGPLEDSGLIARKLAPYRLAVAASPVYLSTRGIPTDPADLAVHDCLVYTSRSRNLDRYWQFQRDGRTHTVDVRCRFQSNDGAALVSAAIEGAGVVLAPVDLLHDTLISGRLIRVLQKYELPSRPMHLLFSPDRRQTPKLRSFIDAAADYFKPTLVPHPSQE
ncbi:LysR family transcriptional regulator [Pseudomonas sp. ES3-33]|uniref:LysR family transcriptional regulator n=1 Tax=Pseudomonas sp. ES3-33 TaxID=1628833 RepID=UPI0005D3D912|nr:LysR family transcriptional regulator [Pseudomonas sp. ES3-33]KJH73770.1 LysR family transcriptional regulator [Pseudomonas sp. ES3-33]